MKALRFDGVKAVLDVRASEPALSSGEALIRPLLLGVSAIDVAIASGKWRGPSSQPFLGILGHEFVGVVDRVAPDSDAARWVGKRVVGSIDIVCGKCDMCRAGLSNHCRVRTVMGVRGRDGCFAERFSLPIRNLSLVPDSVPSDAAVFAEPLAAAIQAAQQIRVEGKSYITVLGDGALGLLTAQVMKRLNASVRVLGKSAEKLAVCERWGVKNRPESEVGRRADQDAVVDCTGAPDGLALAMLLVRPRGKIVLKSFGIQAAAVDLAPLVENEIDLIGSRSGPIADALAMLASAKVDTTGMITRRLRLDDAVEALRAAGGPEQIKVVMEAARA